MIDKLIENIEAIFKTTPLEIASKEFGENLKYKLNKIMPDQIKTNLQNIKELVEEVHEYKEMESKSKINENVCLKAIIETVKPLLNIEENREYLIKELDNINPKTTEFLLNDMGSEQENFVFNVLTKETINKSTDMFFILNLLKNLNNETIKNIKTDLANNQPEWQLLFKRIIESTKSEYINEILEEKLGKDLFKKIDIKENIKTKKIHLGGIDFDEYD